MANRYMLGNLLRGGWAGTFESLDDAWLQLGSRFLLSFPCDQFDKESGEYVENKNGSRFVQMYIHKENEFGIECKVLCKSEPFKMQDRIPVKAEQYERQSDAFFF